MRVTAEHIDASFDSDACGVPTSTLVAFFLCCVCNIIFDDEAVILGFICAVYFIESIRQELIERLLISFFGEI